MSNDNGGIPPQGQQPPAYPGAPVPPQQPAYPSGAPAPQAPVPPAPAYPGSAPQQPAAPVYPGAGQQPAAPSYPGAAPTAPGYPAPSSSQPYGQPYGQPYAAPLKSNGLTIASMICGIASVLLCWVYLILPLALGIPAVIMGHISLKKIKNDPALGGKPMAITGLITGYVGIGLGLIIGVFLIIFIVSVFSVSNSYNY